VSQQARRSEKDKFTALLQDRMSECNYLLSGDVKVDIEWMVHEQDRYESDTSPDVDNVLKPLLDALSGPDGVLVDDCQVQAVLCYWVDWAPHDQQVCIRLSFHPDEWVSKESLCFVHLGLGLCFPINRASNPRGVLLIVEHVDRMLATRNALVKRGRGYYEAQYVMSVQRLFHRTRLGKFTVLELDALRAELAARIASEPVSSMDEEIDSLIAETRAEREALGDLGD
jgi:hypothetical protein